MSPEFVNSASETNSESHYRIKEIGLHLDKSFYSEYKKKLHVFTKYVTYSPLHIILHSANYDSSHQSKLRL
jgi:hypothetical protein